MLGVDAITRIIHRHAILGEAVTVRGMADGAMFADYTSNALFGVGPFKQTWQYEALAVNRNKLLTCFSRIIKLDRMWRNKILIS